MKKGLILWLCFLAVQQTAWAGGAFVADSTVEVQIATNGTVAFTGGTTAIAALKGLANKAPDAIIKKAEQKAQNETLYFTKKEDQGKAHGSTSVSVPKNFNLKFQTAVGSVSLTDVEGRVKGRVENGGISVIRGNGKMELNTDVGDITVTESEASGFVMTRKGNVILQDIKGALTGVSQNGKVTVKTTANYFAGRKPTRFQLNYDQADIDIAAAPEGGDFVVSKGNISSRAVQKSITMKTDEGNLTVAPASTGVRVNTRKGKVSVQVAANANSTEPIIMEAQDGDADLLVPFNFAGNFVITLIQTKNLTGRHIVNSFIDLGTIKTEEIMDPKTKVLISRITQVSRVIRNGKQPVRIRVVNGNVNIKRI